MYTSQTHFGFTNIATSISNFWFGSPCTICIEVFYVISNSSGKLRVSGLFRTDLYYLLGRLVVSFDGFKVSRGVEIWEVGFCGSFIEKRQM